MPDPQKTDHPSPEQKPNPSIAHGSPNPGGQAEQEGADDGVRATPNTGTKNQGSSEETSRGRYLNKPARDTPPSER